MRYLTFIILIFLACQGSRETSEADFQSLSAEPLVAERLTPDYTSWDSLLQAAGQRYDLD